MRETVTAAGRSLRGCCRGEGCLLLTWEGASCCEGGCLLLTEGCQLLLRRLHAADGGYNSGTVLLLTSVEASGCFVSALFLISPPPPRRKGHSHCPPAAGTKTAAAEAAPVPRRLLEGGQAHTRKAPTPLRGTARCTMEGGQGGRKAGREQGCLCSKRGCKGRRG
jgi:hypothetical protein